MKKKILICVLFVCVALALFFGLDTNKNEANLVIKCAQKYPNYETTQKLEFEICINN